MSFSIKVTEETNADLVLSAHDLLAREFQCSMVFCLRFNEARVVHRTIKLDNTHAIPELSCSLVEKVLTFDL